MSDSINILERARQGIPYPEFMDQIRRKVESPDSAARDEVIFEYIRLNFQRATRIAKTGRIESPLRALLESIETPQWWIAITEDWCGDSAQILPYVAKMSELNPRIRFRILPREQYPEVMDQYLTDGKRSIPKIVALDDDGNELFQWGSRPAPAHRLVKALRDSGAPKADIQKALHTWYAKDRGRSFQEEIAALLKREPFAEESINPDFDPEFSHHG